MDQVSLQWGDWKEESDRKSLEKCRHIKKDVVLL